MNIPSYLCTNGCALLLLIIVLWSSYRIFNHELLDSKLMNIMIGIAMIGCIVETVDYTNNGIIGDFNRVFGTILSSIEYIGNALFAFTWAVYADFKIFGDVQRLKKRIPFLFLPAFSICICSLINLFTPVFFRIDKSTCVYMRTDLYLIPNLVVLFYLLYGAFMISWYKDRSAKYLFMPVMIFMIPIMIGAVLDFLFYGIAVKQMGIAISLTSVYINIQKEISCTDSLSGLHTRQYVMNYLKTELSRSKTEKKTAGILIDIDKFKSINDTYGHLAGDDAIQSIGKILYQVVDKKNMAVRYAGDEFMVIYHFEQEKEIEEFVQKIRKATKDFNDTKEKPYKLSFSAGYSILDHKNDSLDTFFERMDQAMYREKKEKSEGVNL